MLKTLAMVLAVTAATACSPARAPALGPKPSGTLHVAAIYRPTIVVPTMYRLERGVPPAIQLTSEQRHVLHRVKAQLNPRGLRDLAMAFVPSDEHGKKMVLFIEPRSGLPLYSGRRSLGDCISRPDCRHYCGFFYVPSMNSLSIDTIYENRCADNESIWRRT